MKNVVVTYFGDDWDISIPFSSELTRKAFEDWHIMGVENKISFFRASIHWYDSKKGVFKKAWAFRSGEWRKIEQEIIPDLIYDKVGSKHDYQLFELKKEIAKKVQTLNDPQFRAIIGNKLSQYMLFMEYMPKSFIATNLKEAKKLVKKLKSSKAVMKPLYGSGGDGIVIDNKENIFNHEYEFPLLVQEFIVSEKGIPGFSEKDEVSDLRLVFNQHKLTYALSRIAKEGSLFTNLHQGASAKIVPTEYIPVEVLKKVKKIQKRLKIFPIAQYSLDFIFDNGGRSYLVELNTTPGMDLLYSLGEEELIRRNFRELIDLLGR